jgi:hypothetical protein
MSVKAIFKFIATTVPAIIVLGGIFLLVLGYPIDHAGIIRSGWGSIIFGGFLYILEIIADYYSD